MKPIADWDENYIIGLPRGEFDWIEFKGRRALDFSISGVDENKVIDELSKQLSAFANSGGGTLVYGFTDPKDLSSRTVEEGGVSLKLRGRNTKEWLEDIIPNLIDHPLQRFNVYALVKSAQNPSIQSDRCVILVSIPDSEDAPHQARDNKYYARVGGKSRPIGHRLVTDIYGRRRYPSFEVQFSLESMTYVPARLPGMPSFGHETAPKRSVKLTAKAQNTGRVFAKYVECFFHLPHFLIDREDRHEYSMIEIDGRQYSVWRTDNTRRDVLKSNYLIGAEYGPSWFDPILSGLDRNWTISCSNGLRPEDIGGEAILWRIHADNAPPNEGRCKLSSIPFTVRDTHRVV